MAVTGGVGGNTTHVALFAFPFSTHAAPLLQITRRLAAHAPTTIFSFFNTAQSNSSIFSSSSLEEEEDDDQDQFNNIRRCDVWDGVPEGYVFKGKPQEDIELFMRSAPETLRKATAAAEAETGRNLTCMLGDAFLWFVADLAKDKAVPWVALWTSNEHSLSTHVNTDLIRQQIGIQGAERKRDEHIAFIPGMSRIRVRDLPDGVILGNLQSLFSTMLHQMGRALPQAALVFANSFEELDPVVTDDLNSKLHRFVHVGPFNLLAQRRPKDQLLLQQHSTTHISLTWLNLQLQHKEAAGSVAYVSFGSVARPSQAEVVALAQGLEESGVKFLWSLRENLKTFLPDGFAERTRANGLVLPWVPQVQVLGHEAVGVFITHFGWNSLLESIAAGVPVIGRPFLGEQKLNGRLVEDVWEIGMQVEDGGGVVTKEGVKKSLELVLYGDQGKKMKDNIAKLRLLAEKAVTPQPQGKGSSLNNLKLVLETVTAAH